MWCSRRVSPAPHSAEAIADRGLAIDYVVDIHSEREKLLARLARAQAQLDGPPALPADGARLWEREWSGGSISDDEEESDE